MCWMIQYRVNNCVFKSLRKLSPNTWNSQIRQWVPGQRASNRDSPSAVRLQPVSRKDQESSTGRSEMLPRSDFRDQRSTKFCGAWPCRQLCTMMQNLYVTRSGTLSQCSSMCSNCAKIMSCAQCADNCYATDSSGMSLMLILSLSELYNNTIYMFYHPWGLIKTVL